MIDVVHSQYNAVHAMFHRAVEDCSESTWLEPAFTNRTWRVAYHTLFFMDLYLSESLETFRPWKRHVAELESLGPMVHKDGKIPVEGPPYSREDILEYSDLCREAIPVRLERLDFDGPSGFFWLPFSKLELQFYNIRHIQHHTGQIVDRIRQREECGVEWVAKG